MAEIEDLKACLIQFFKYMRGVRVANEVLLDSLSSMR